MTGTRDLACPELWERSLERSLRRRHLAAQRRPGVHTVSAVALAATLATPTAAGAALLRTHSRGPAVTVAQRALGVAADGEFGPMTRGAVRQFQRAHGLVVDGIIGPVTAAALGIGGGQAADGPAPPASTTRSLQAKLGLGVDGVYGPVTRAAVRAFQRAHGLEVDGVVGPQTLGALGLSAAAPATTMAAPAATSASSAVAAAQSQIGARYVFGGTGNGGWDCSGLVQWAMGKAGISLPRTSYAQYGAGAPVSAIQAGDLVFFNTDGSGASHVGIATGPNSAISATTHGVMQHEITTGYWGSHYIGARRV